MAVKGALETGFAVSEAKPGNRSEAGYDGLATRVIAPSAFTDADDTLTIPQADYDTLVVGEPARLSDVGGLMGLAVDTDRYLVKEAGSNIGFASTFAEALAGTKIVLGGALGTAMMQVSNFKPCGELTNVGEFGREYNVVPVMNLATGATRKFKGSYNNGSVQADLLFDSADVGQTILEQAEVSTATYAFRVNLPGNPAEQFYFEGLVTMLKRIVGGADDAIMLRATVEIDHRSIVEGSK